MLISRLILSIISQGQRFRNSVYFIILALIIYACTNKPGSDISVIDKSPVIEPDYSGLTIPPNIAPMNFMIKEEGTAFFVKFSSASGSEFGVSSKKGKILIPERKWKKMLSENPGKELKTDIFIRDAEGKWSKYKTVTNNVSSDPIDPFLFYRLLYPGYESWSELSINSRNLETFKTKSLIENSVADDNCVNCHAVNNGRTDNFMFHMRGSMGGTYLYSKGEFRKLNLKTKEMKNGAVYPRWHPSGKFIAFSSNKIIQQFHSSDNKKVEVSDLESSLVLYDIDKNEMMNIEMEDMEKFMDTFPEWSPDGRYLYFCRTPQVGENYDYRQIKYNLYRVPFNIETRSFGEAELVFDASAINKSISFPRISPEGKYLVFTLFDYGTFSIWHKEADLHTINLETLESSKLDLNSDFADSYHSWSSNGRWLIFSSKRDDGLTARPYIAYIDVNGRSAKPFILPQEDPEFYGRFLKSFNIPEFSTTDIKLTPGKIRKLAKTVAVQSKWATK